MQGLRARRILVPGIRPPSSRLQRSQGINLGPHPHGPCGLAHCPWVRNSGRADSPEEGGLLRLPAGLLSVFYPLPAPSLLCFPLSPIVSPSRTLPPCSDLQGSNHQPPLACSSLCPSLSLSLSPSHLHHVGPSAGPGHRPKSPQDAPSPFLSDLVLMACLCLCRFSPSRCRLAYSGGALPAASQWAVKTPGPHNPKGRIDEKINS